MRDEILGWFNSTLRRAGDSVLLHYFVRYPLRIRLYCLADSTWLIKSRINNHLFSTGSGTDAFAFSGQITEFSVDGSNLVPVAAQSTKGNAHAIK